MFVILVWNNLFPYTVTGPRAQLTRTKGDGGMCNKYWWTNLLYINNFHPKKFEEEVTLPNSLIIYFREHLDDPGIEVQRSNSIII